MSKLFSGVSGLAAAILLLAGCTHHHRESEESSAPAPAAVTSAITSAYPGAQITATHSEKEEIDLFEVSFTADGKKHDADVTPDGTILSVEETVGESDVPAAALSAIRNAAQGASVRRYEKATKMANVDKTTHAITRLSTPQVSYEAALARDDMHAEVAVDADGTVTEQPKWKKRSEKED